MQEKKELYSNESKDIMKLPDRPAILLYKKGGIVGNLIKWQTRSKYCHAALYLGNGEIVESVIGKGVIIRNINNNDLENADVFHVDADNEVWNHVINFAIGQIGKKYDYWAIIRFISRQYMPKNENWFCVEFIAEGFVEARFPLLHRIESSNISPGLLSFSPLLTSYIHD